MNFNSVVLLGHLTRDPAIEYTPSGKAVCKFGMAINRGEEVTFVNIVAWDRLAERCNSYLNKGSPCLVDGRLVIRSYDKDGERKTATEVVIHAMQLIGSRRDGEERRAPSTSAPVDLDDYEDIPF